MVYTAAETNAVWSHDASLDARYLSGSQDEVEVVVNKSTRVPRYTAIDQAGIRGNATRVSGHTEPRQQARDASPTVDVDTMLTDEEREGADDEHDGKLTQDEQEMLRLLMKKMKLVGIMSKEKEVGKTKREGRSEPVSC